LIGYPDDFAAEEHIGYELLRESDFARIFSNDVIFDEEAAMTPLHNFDSENPLEATIDDLFVDTDISSTEHSSDGGTGSEKLSAISITSPSSREYSSEHVSDSTEDESSTSIENSILSELSNSVEDYYSADEEPHLESSDSNSTDNYSNIDRAIKQGQVTSRFTEQNNSSGIINLLHQSNNHCMPKSLIALLSKDDSSIPETYHQAISSPDKEKWLEAMSNEFRSLKEHNTFALEPLPSGRKEIKGRWVFTKKYSSTGQVKRFKARWVAKGFTQVEGIDFHETFAPVVNFKSVRVIVALAAHKGWHMYQDDVPTAFLRASLDETIYMQQPIGFEHGTKSCRLIKSLYGLRQSPRLWNEYFDTFLRSQGLQPTPADPCVYVSDSLVVALFVDDILTTGISKDAILKFRASMQSYFNMDPTNGGILEWYLGIQFLSNTEGIAMNQSLYLKEKLNRYSRYIASGGASSPLPSNFQELLQTESEPAPPNFPYRSMVGSLMYAMVCTRPDLALAVSIASRYLAEPKKVHCDIVSHIWKYVRNNLNLGLQFTRGDGTLTLEGYVDASYANEPQCKSTTGFIFLLGGSAVSWVCQRQSCIAQSTAEAEYYAAVSAGNEVIWLKQLLADIKEPQQTVTIHEDNNACIVLSRNPQDHKRTKHVQIKYHVLRDYVKKKELELKYCPTKSQLADMLTKSLAGCHLRPHLDALGIRRLPGPEFGGVLNSEFRPRSA
jgi:hypothetical protein